MPSTTLTTPGEFDAALAHERILLHIDVNWAIHAINSRPVVAKSIASIETTWPGKVQFYNVDLSDQSGPLWDYMRTWFKRQHASGVSLSAGCGAVVWIANGQFQIEVPNAMSLEAEKLTTLTQSVFKLSSA